MLRTLAVLFAVVGGYYLISPHVSGHRVPALPASQVTAEITIYRQQAGYPAHLATGLPATWQVTHVRTGGSQPPLRLSEGWVVGGTQYVQLEEDAAPAGRFVAEQLGRGAHMVGEVLVDGAVWQRWSSAGTPEALVRSWGTVTAVLSGGAPLGDLERLAHALG